MSGISCNRNKKNCKPNKFVNVPVLQVKSLKLEPNKPATSEGKGNARSEDDLRKNRNSEISNETEKIDLQPAFSNVGDATDESQNLVKDLDETALPGPQIDDPAIGDSSENLEEQFASYKYYAGKHTKSIKFTDEVAVLYFNGEDTLCQSSEPLKKELDQQIRNKEMRREHLMGKGQFDNVYLF